MDELPTVKQILTSFALEQKRTRSVSLMEIEICDSAIKKTIKQNILSQAEWIYRSYCQCWDLYIGGAKLLYASKQYSADHDRVLWLATFIDCPDCEQGPWFKTAERAKEHCESELKNWLDKLVGS